MRWLVLLLFATAGCFPTFPMEGSSRPRFRRAELIDKVGSSGCYSACRPEHYAYCNTVRLPGKIAGGPDRYGTVCYYDR